MSWAWHSDLDVKIDDLIGDIIDRLVAQGGWTEPDAGYNVVRTQNAVTGEQFDVYMVLETTDKRYIQFDVGEWDTGTHAMKTGVQHKRHGHLLHDGTGSASGTATGVLKMSYDDNYFIVVTDYKANGADYRRCLSFVGLATPRDSGDTVRTNGATLYRGTNAVPTNDAAAGEIIVHHDTTGTLSAKIYSCYVLCMIASGGISNFVPRGNMLEIVANQRDCIEIYLAGNAALTGSEESGMRARLPNLYHGFYDDDEAYGCYLLAPDGKEYWYFQQADTFSYAHLPTRLLVRCK